MTFCCCVYEEDKFLTSSMLPILIILFFFCSRHEHFSSCSLAKDMPQASSLSLPDNDVHIQLLALSCLLLLPSDKPSLIALWYDKLEK